MTNTEGVLRHFRKCPVCDRNYRNARMLLVYKNSDRTGFHITCPSCETRVLVFVQPNQMGVMSVGMVTDLGAEEVAEKIKLPSVSPNEVLDLYGEITSSEDGLSKELLSRQISG